MTITEYENLEGVPMVLIIDEANDKGESMSKAEYERRQAQQVEQDTLVTESAPTAQQGVALLIQPPLGVGFFLPRRGYGDGLRKI